MTAFQINLPKDQLQSSNAAELLTDSAKGATMVEFSIILAILLLFVLGAIEFALIMHTYGNFSSSLRAAARTAIVNGENCEQRTAVLLEENLSSRLIKNLSYEMTSSREVLSDGNALFKITARTFVGCAVCYPLFSGDAPGITLTKRIVFPLETSEACNP